MVGINVNDTLRVSCCGGGSGKQGKSSEREQFEKEFGRSAGGHDAGCLLNREGRCAENAGRAEFCRKDLFEATETILLHGCMQGEQEPDFGEHGVFGPGTGCGHSGSLQIHYGFGCNSEQVLWQPALCIFLTDFSFAALSFRLISN